MYTANILTKASLLKCDAISCGRIYWHFARTCCLYLQGIKRKPLRKMGLRYRNGREGHGSSDQPMGDGRDKHTIGYSW